MVCADCCELTDGAGHRPLALCSGCAKHGGAILASAWRGLLGWIALILLPLVAVAALVYVLRR
jgi:K+-transporting ATPase A subunit